MTHGNGPAYHVRMSKQTRLHLKQLHADAASVGKGAPFLSAFRHIIDKLQTDPWTFGEPLFSLPALKLQIRKAIILPVVVDYGVHEEKPLVFIRGFKALS